MSDEVRGSSLKMKYEGMGKGEGSPNDKLKDTKKDEGPPSHEG